MTAEVDGRRYAVRLWVPDLGPIGPTPLVGRGTQATGLARGGRRRGLGLRHGPHQGTIVRVLVAEGDAVEVGQGICVLEAMKMENAINADKAGVIKELRVAEGDSVAGGDVVAVIE